MGNRAIWESEDWLKQNAKPLKESGGVGARAAIRADGGKVDEDSEQQGDGNEGEDNAMEE